MSLFDSMLSIIMQATFVEFISVPNFLELIVRFAFNMLIVLFIARYIYFRISRRRDFYFTYILISTTVFFICYLLDSVRIELGFALGLFAVFGIIRYRTDAIPIKEMTFLFVLIGISVINALASETISYSELLFTNFGIVATTWMMEIVWREKQETRKFVLYEKIELIKPENEAKLIEDLEQRTGLHIVRVEIGKIDFLKDTAELTIIHKSYPQPAQNL